MYKLKIISSTVRPGRKGPIIGRWLVEQANATGNFEAELLDLGEINLPLMNEPVHPVMRQYEHEHTKTWSTLIDDADAFIFLTAEYDYSYPAPLKNALEYLVHEWSYKAAAIASYSAGSFAGVRGLATLKPDLLSLRIVPIPEAVNIPLLNQSIDETGNFTPNELVQSSCKTMLDQLLRWTRGMEQIRKDV